MSNTSLKPKQFYKVKTKMKPKQFSQVTINQNVPFSKSFLWSMKLKILLQSIKNYIKYYLCITLIAVLIPYGTYLLQPRLFRLNKNFMSFITMLRQYNSTTDNNKPFKNYSFKQILHLPFN